MSPFFELATRLCRSALIEVSPLSVYTSAKYALISSIDTSPFSLCTVIAKSSLFIDLMVLSPLSFKTLSTNMFLGTFTTVFFDEVLKKKPKIELLCLLL